MHVIAAKAVAFGEAMKPSFKKYQEQVMKNAKALARELGAHGLRIVTGRRQPTATCFLVDLRPKGITGKVAEEALRSLRASPVNKNASVATVRKKPFIASGIRIGTTGHHHARA